MKPIIFILTDRNFFPNFFNDLYGNLFGRKKFKAIGRTKFVIDNLIKRLKSHYY